jgi:hypothetical protein
MQKEQLANKLPIVIAGLLLLASLPLPWWQFKVVAPQYPKGLKVSVYVNRLEGDVREISLLNHYIGMKSLSDAAQIERKNRNTYRFVGGAAFARFNLFAT